MCQTGISDRSGYIIVAPFVKVITMVRIGIDVGSTTAKLVVIGSAGEMLFSRYTRHNAKAKEVVCGMLHEAESSLGDVEARVKVTGSVGMGLSELTGIPLVQEVVAASKAVQANYPQVRSMIDIGGEDAKVVFFENAEAKDLRMNGNCAGGTGAFIDQMAVILGVDVEDMNELAQNACRIYPIASRCGVFCKTDIQNLIAKNVSKQDIAASIFHAVAVQTVVTLAHGCDIGAPVLFCGGPLTFIPALRKAFTDYLHLAGKDVILPDSGTLLPAIGTALDIADSDSTHRISDIIGLIGKNAPKPGMKASALRPIFSSCEEYKAWKERIAKKQLPRARFKKGKQEVFLGIDSGSTTTKIVVTDTDNRLLFCHYDVNGGNPVQAVEKGLLRLKDECTACGAELDIAGSCSTGYGEDLIKAAFQLNAGIVETIAHYVAASHIDKDVSFILDIGGQDMKAIFVNEGIINRMEINEACSSGCGSFIETFAKTLGYTVQDFAHEACLSTAPCDLGTRCTVFMNSKVKQVLREGATVSDIAAGLAYSVVKNCLYKVLKLKNVSELGKHIVVQGGTMRGDAVVRALERLTGAEVSRCDVPELMGAYGCALYAGRHPHAAVTLDGILAKMQYTTKLLHCKGCDNRCLVSRYDFASGKRYYSGNRCERVFTNGEGGKRAANVYEQKNRLLFGRAEKTVPAPRLTVGLPRCLNMYEDFPFWHTLLTACGFQVVLSEVSDFGHYESCARMVMSDNICFPAKLVHSHIQDLIEKKVDRIFMPFVIFGRKGREEQNSYNCPIVTGYSEVIKSVQGHSVPVDAPAISFKDRTLLHRQCRTYLKGLGVRESVITKALAKAETEFADYVSELTAYNRETLAKAAEAGRFVILLAGRPYHADPLIQHKIADMIADMGIDVITDDIVRKEEADMPDAHFLAQWTFPNRILKAAQWCATQGGRVQFVQLTSFGCGPDAFLTDEVRDLLMRNGKSYTLLKLDDINNVGSMKLRVRSLVESLRLKNERRGKNEGAAERPFVTTADYDRSMQGKKILVPFFTPFISPLIPAIMRVAGYDVETLPVSDAESCEWGLRYANNEVCYPATLIVGDIIKAFRSGKHDPQQTVVAMVQTGGQCRASNYLALIRKALADAGYTDTPVISLTFGTGIDNGQAHFRINWASILPVALRAILFSDCISKFYHAARVREKEPGQAARLRDTYLHIAGSLIAEGGSDALYDYLGQAASRFDSICRDIDCPRVGVVGEIFLKFNPFAHKNVTEWLAERGVETVPTVLTDFFMQAFVNREVRVESHIARHTFPKSLYRLGYRVVWKQIEKVNGIAGRFRYFTPFKDIFAEAEEARKVISLNAQFGEGWLLPADIMAYARQGVNNVVSLQPFGCIANHIVSKGIEKRIKALLPQMNILSLDFDSGVSDVNIANRLLLFVDSLCAQRHAEPRAAI